MIRTEMITKKAARWSLLAAAFFFAGCSSTYNEYYEDEHLPTDNVTNNEDDSTFTDEIIPTLSDPQYEIIKTRGTGPFDPYSRDKKHWLEAPFHAFALLTSNSRSRAYSVDYSKTDNVHRLLWDQAYYMDDALGNGHFYSDYVKDPSKEVRKYYNEHKDFRYKFFLFHSDDAELVLPPNMGDPFIPTDKKVSVELKLDGTQDLMHSFAYHTREEYNRAIAQLPNDATTALFLQGNQPAGSPVENEYIYSGMSGNRGIHPIFKMNHLLTRFKIRVQGAKSSPESPDNYLLVLIDSVKISAPTAGTLTIADDNWERDSYRAAVDAGALFTPKPESVDIMKSEVEHRPMKNTGDTLGIDFSLLDDEYNSIILNDGTPLYDKDVNGAYHHVKTMKYSEYLSADFLLPPQQEYKMFWHGRVLHVRKEIVDGKEVTHLGLVPPEQNNEAANFYRVEKSNRTVKLGLDENGTPQSFQPGMSYTINLFVYGDNEVKLVVVPDVEWEEGGEIDINKDNDEYLGE